MFRTLLLATVVGSVGAATTPARDLDERGNSPPSYFCSSSKNKCSAVKQQSAVSTYCSSLLAIPRITNTKTVSTCKTVTSTITSYTRTVTKTAAAATTTVYPATTITSCAAPSNTAIEARDAREKRAAATKPSCLPSEKQSVSAACSCLSLRPLTVTTTVTSTDIKHARTTVKAYTTITQSADIISTVTATGTGAISYALPTSFYIQNDRGEYLINPLDIKEVQDVAFDESSDDEVLFALNAAGNLIHENGKTLVESAQLTSSSERYSIEVTTADQSSIDAGTVDPLTCSVSYSAEDGTCPLTCQVEAGDVSQGSGSGDWFLGPPGFASNTTYNTFAVVRGTATGRGGAGRRKRSRR